MIIILEKKKLFVSPFYTNLLLFIYLLNDREHLVQYTLFLK